MHCVTGDVYGACIHIAHPPQVPLRKVPYSLEDLPGPVDRLSAWETQMCCSSPFQEPDQSADLLQVGTGEWTARGKDTPPVSQRAGKPGPQAGQSDSFVVTAIKAVPQRPPVLSCFGTQRAVAGNRRRPLSTALLDRLYQSTTGTRVRSSYSFYWPKDKTKCKKC